MSNKKQRVLYNVTAGQVIRYLAVLNKSDVGGFWRLASSAEAQKLSPGTKDFWSFDVESSAYDLFTGTYTMKLPDRYDIRRTAVLVYNDADALGTVMQDNLFATTTHDISYMLGALLALLVAAILLGVI